LLLTIVTRELSSKTITVATGTNDKSSIRKKGLRGKNKKWMTKRKKKKKKKKTRLSQFVNGKTRALSGVRGSGGSWRSRFWEAKINWLVWPVKHLILYIINYKHSYKHT
jgi:hypothetical protein